jgi:hypothetical protein
MKISARNDLLGLAGYELRGAVAGDEIPCDSAEKVGEVEVGEPVEGWGGYRIERSGECKQGGECRCNGECDSARGKGAVALEVDRERDCGKAVGGHESVDRERTHPAVDVDAGDAVGSESAEGERSEEASEEDGGAGGGVLLVGGAEMAVGESVVGHAHQHAGGGGDAGEGAGEHTDQRAEVDEWTEWSHADQVRKDAQWCG